MEPQFRFPHALSVPGGRGSRYCEIGPGHGELASRFIEAGFSNYDVVEPNDLMRSGLQQAGVP